MKRNCWVNLHKRRIKAFYVCWSISFKFLFDTSQVLWWNSKRIIRSANIWEAHGRLNNLVNWVLFRMLTIEFKRSSNGNWLPTFAFQLDFLFWVSCFFLFFPISRRQHEIEGKSESRPPFNPQRKHLAIIGRKKKHSEKFSLEALELKVRPDFMVKGHVAFLSSSHLFDTWFKDSSLSVR